MVLAAEAVVGSLAVNHDEQDPFKPGTLLTQFKDQYQWGRKTLEVCPDNHGLMPNPENGCSGLKDIFIDHIFNAKIGEKGRWRMTAALSGAHSLGFAKPENSGYDGFWGSTENQGIFNSDYYRIIAANGWGPQRAVGGNPDKNQWKLIDRASDADKASHMMLDTDMCMFYQKNTIHAACMAKVIDDKTRNREACKKYEKLGDFLSAKNSTCCAWMQHVFLTKEGWLDDENE